MTQREQLVADALDLWAPTYPRRVSRYQDWARARSEAVRRLLDAEDDPEDSPFVSTFAFPRGHTKNDKIPEINTLFIDFDIENGDYERGSGDREAWQRDMSHLLLRARRMASVINDSDQAPAWRASLSGHKGIHLFLDFPEVDLDNGEFDQYVAGLNDYAEDLIGEFVAETGLDDLAKYVDVTSSDLGRLCRVPNTVHGGATASFGETRYCVPVTLDELSDLTPEDYERLSRELRPIPWEQRYPADEVTDIINQYIRLASPGDMGGRGSGHGSERRWNRVEEYREQSNDDLSLEDVRLLTSDMPCVWKFHEREDKFRHGNQSHEMESHCIAKLLSSNFPIEVIKEFLSNAPEYDERYTEQRIEELIARDFNPYTTEKLLRRAPEFCGYDWCVRCQSVIEDDEELQRIFS